MSPHELLVFDFEHGAPAYTVTEVCELCDVSLEHLVSFVEFGVLKPEGQAPGDWRFPPHAIMIARRASRLQRDLELEMPGLALAMELLEEISDLRRQVERLRSQLACFTSDP